MKYLVGLSLLIALPLLYGVAYWAMLNGKTVPVGSVSGMLLAERPHYRFVGEVSGMFFAPAHEIDRRIIRPNLWIEQQPEMSPER